MVHRSLSAVAVCVLLMACGEPSVAPKPTAGEIKTITPSPAPSLASPTPGPTDGLISTPTPEPTPVIGRDADLVAFVQHGPDESAASIYLVESDGGTPFRLPGDTRAKESSPIWSLDGQRLYFVVDKGDGPQLHAMEMSSGAEEVVGPVTDYVPIFSPDGRYVAWNPDYDGARGAIVLDRATGLLSSTPALGTRGYRDIHFSPDGSLLLLGSPCALYDVRAGKMAKQLKEDRGLCNWLPDGRVLYYTIAPLATPNRYGGYDQWQLHALDLTSGQVEDLAEEPDSPYRFQDGKDQIEPDGTDARTSPGGQQVLFSCVIIRPGALDAAPGVCAGPRGGPGARLLAAFSFYSSAMNAGDWSPDGTSVVITPDQSLEVRTLSDGTSRVLVPSLDSRVYFAEPAWRPRG